MNDAPILDRIQADMAAAMKSRDADTLSTLRMLKAALMEAKTRKAKDETLGRDEEIEVLQRYAKKRRESIEELKKLGMEDRVPREEQEIEVTRRYLPESLSDAELMAVVREAIAATGAAGPKDMGKAMKAVMTRLAGMSVDGKQVSEAVKKRLGG